MFLHGVPIHSWRVPACASVYTSFILGVFFASVFDEKIKDPYKDVRSAALEVVANNWKSIYSAASNFFIASQQNI